MRGAADLGVYAETFREFLLTVSQSEQVEIPVSSKTKKCPQTLL
jgi:hypothetical protein